MDNARDDDVLIPCGANAATANNDARMVVNRNMFFDAAMAGVAMLTNVAQFTRR